MNTPEFVVAVVGPTATGKSALGVELAVRLGGEVISADASQLYRHMDIGTAKITASEARGVPHHQIDVLDIHDEASVAAYQRHARSDIDAVLARGRVPVVVGGSGLYVRAALDHLDIPPTDARVRTRLEREGADNLRELRDRLARLDPAAAAAIEPNNARRIVRALEVIELTGRPFSATMPRREFVRPTVMVRPHVERADLDDRIARRAARMFATGLLQEVEALAARGLAETRTASRAVGYREALDVLAGRSSVSEAVTATSDATRRLAKRQRQWFGADPRVVTLGERPIDEALRLVDECVAQGADAPDERPRP